MVYLQYTLVLYMWYIQNICYIIIYDICIVHIFSVNKQIKGNNWGDGSGLGNICTKFEFDLVKRDEWNH